MTRPFTVIGLHTHAHGRNIHGTCATYTQASALASVCRKTWPGRTVLVDIPKPRAS